MKTTKIHTIKMYDKTYRIRFALSAYRNNGAPAIVAINEDDGDVFAVVSVNIPGYDTGDNMVVADTNNCEELIDAMEREGVIGEPEDYIQSGFCVYPVVKINKEVFNEDHGEEEAA